MEIDEVKITIVATGFENPADAAEPTIKKQETLLSNSNNINNLKSRMVVGGYNDNEDILDVPTFLRKQMD
jgi:cell division protein FtsZ